MERAREAQGNQETQGGRGAGGGGDVVWCCPCVCIVNLCFARNLAHALVKGIFQRPLWLRRPGIPASA